MHVCIQHGSNLPVKGAIVKFEVLNQSEFFPVALIITDEDGTAGITLGLADIHISVIKEGNTAEGLADTSLIDHIEIQLYKASVQETKVREIKINVPEGDNNRCVMLTEEQNLQKKQKVSNADKIREEKVASFFREQEADEIAAKYPCKEELKTILYKARGNFDEIIKYLAADVEKDNPDLRVKLLKSLLDKDFCDLKSDILLEHFKRSLVFNQKYEEEMFVRYVMCPRIYFEMITPYREFIEGYFDEKTKTNFINNPNSFKYIRIVRTKREKVTII